MANRDQEIKGKIKLLKEYVATCARCPEQVRSREFTREQFRSWIRRVYGWTKWYPIGWVCRECKEKLKSGS